MAKKLYSLMLNEQVVEAVDREAHRRGTNRSALIDAVLAEHFGVVTAQRVSGDIFRQMEALLSASEELIPFFAPHSGSFYVKSALAYKYRPTLKYELVLDSASETKLGDLSVNFRTQSVVLLRELEDFFKLWAGIEKQLLSEEVYAKIDYTLYPNRFVRSVALPAEHNLSAQEIAEAVSAYVALLDASLKKYIHENCSARELMADYHRYMQQSAILI